MDEVRDLIVEEETHMKESRPSYWVTLNAESKGKLISKGRRGRNPSSDSSDKDDELKNGRCHYYHKKGHSKRECLRERARSLQSWRKHLFVEGGYSDALVATVNGAGSPIRRE